MKIELRSLEEIQPYPGNPRNNEEAVDAVAASLKEYGFRQPIVVDSAGVIIVGHTRYKAAKKLGLAKVPVHVATDLSEAQVKAYRIADNATNEIAEWNYEMLPIELSALQEMNYDLGLLGFDDAALQRMMSSEVQQGLTDPDEVPEVPEEATTKPGDLWLLGEHRLLCGDSTNTSDVAKLMNGEEATMMFTDPPWNVAIGLDSNPRHRQRQGLKNDSLPPEQFQKFLDGFISAVSDHITGDLYCVFAHHDHRLLAEHFLSEGRWKTEGRGRQLDEWKLRTPGADNHWLDCLVGCAVGASMQGVVLFGTDAKTPTRRRIKLSDLQGRRG